MTFLKMKPKKKQEFEKWNVPIHEGEVFGETTQKRKRLVRFSDEKSISPFTNKPDYWWCWKGHYKKEK